ncbi:MAG: lysozyme [Casimicrobiaceae bacterium]
MSPQGRILAAALGSVAMATSSIQYTLKWEGMRTNAYMDMVGVPTICVGRTLGVKMGDRATVEQCKAWLEEDLVRHWEGIAACAPKIAEAPGGYKVAMLDLAFNIGVGAWCRSSLQRLTMTGQYHQACKRTLQFVYAGGKFVQGLANRRNDLYPVCLSNRYE